MGLFDNMYIKRKAKLAASAAPFLGTGEVARTTTICQSEKQARDRVMGKQPYVQLLATATDENFYLFGISPFKNEIYPKSVHTAPLATLDAHMDGGNAIVGELTLAPMRVEKEL